MTHTTAWESSQRVGDLLQISHRFLGMQPQPNRALCTPLRKLRSRPGGRGSLRASPCGDSHPLFGCGRGLSAPPWEEAGIVFSMAGCGKIAHTEQSKHSAGAAAMGTAGRRWQLEARGGRLRLGPGSPWSQESASTDPEGLKGARGGLTQGIPQGHP